MAWFKAYSASQPAEEATAEFLQGLLQPELEISLGVLSVITEIFDPQGLIVSRASAKDKAGMASTLTEVLKSYMKHSNQ